MSINIVTLNGRLEMPMYIVIVTKCSNSLIERVSVASAVNVLPNTLTQPLMIFNIFV